MARADNAKGRQLDAEELGAWRGFLRTHAVLVRALDEELQRAHGLPLTHYDVLVQLESAPGGRLRMAELADAVLLSRSGLTRLVDRLERGGLVTREPCEEDARGYYAVISEAGHLALRAARRTHLAGVRRLFLELLDDADQDRLTQLWGRLQHQAAGLA